MEKPRFEDIGLEELVALTVQVVEQNTDGDRAYIRAADVARWSALSDSQAGRAIVALRDGEVDSEWSVEQWGGKRRTWLWQREPGPETGQEAAEADA